MLQIYLKYKAIEFRVLWFLKKAQHSREEPDISLARHAFTCFILLARRAVVHVAMILYTVY